MNGRSRVIGFAHEEISLDDRAGCRLPVCPGRHDFGAAVGILEVQLTLEARAACRNGRAACRSRRSRCTSHPPRSRQGVVPRMNPVGHIIGAVSRPVLVWSVQPGLTGMTTTSGALPVFAETTRLIRELTPDCRVEVLIPDFQGLDEPFASCSMPNPMCSMTTPRACRGFTASFAPAPVMSEP